MAFDYKKEYKEFYMPKNTPSVNAVEGTMMIRVEAMGFQTCSLRPKS